MPKNESHEDGQSGVRREKVAGLQAECDVKLIEKAFARDDLIGIDPQMRNVDKECSESKKHCYRFQDEDNVLRFCKDKYRTPEDRPKSTFHNDWVQINYRKIVE